MMQNVLAAFPKRMVKKRKVAGLMFLLFLLMTYLQIGWISHAGFHPRVLNYNLAQVQSTEESRYTREIRHRLVDFVNSIRATNKSPVLLTIINRGYLTIAYNWLCHTAQMEGVHENTIFMVQGKETEMELKERWPNIKTISVNQKEHELEGSQKFGTVGYVRMMVRRTDLLNSLIQSNISFVLFETDFIWFENPVPDLIRMGTEQDFDIVGTISTAPFQIMCGALIYFRDTVRMRALWAEVTRQINELRNRIQWKNNLAEAPLRENEQIYLNKLLKKNYADSRYGLVDYDVVVDGKWYTMSKMQRKQLRPKAIHNNFLDMSAHKRRRFRKFNQWLLDADNSCNSTKVTELFERSPHDTWV